MLIDRKRSGSRHCFIFWMFIAMEFGVCLSLASGDGSIKRASANVEKFVSGDWEYELDEDGNAIITKYFGNADEIVLDEKIEGHTIVGLGPSSNGILFKNYDTLKSITLPDTIVILDGAFSYCTQLSEIRMSEKLRVIGNNAFYACVLLNDIMLPKELEEISPTAFIGCTALTDVYLDHANKNLCFENGILYNKSKTKLIKVFKKDIKTLNVDKCVLKIGAYAFSECNQLKSVTLPDTLDYIGDRAFDGLLHLQQIVIPLGVTDIGECILASCPELIRVEILGPVKDLKGICNNCYSLAQVLLPESVKTVSGFLNCTSLKQIDLPENVEIIEEDAFRLSGLSAIKIPLGVTSIDERALPSRCLEKVEVAEGNSRFYARQDGLYNNENVLLAGCVQNDEVEISEGCCRIGAYAFEGRTEIVKIKIPNTVYEIGDSAFLMCSNLISIEIGNQLTALGRFAFSDTKLIEQSIIEENGVCYLGAYAISFQQESHKGVVKIKEGCTLIADSCFFGDRTIEYVVFPDSLKCIDQSAFSGSSVKEISGGNSLVSIGEFCFSGADKLERVFLRGNKVVVGESAFAACHVLSELMIEAKEVKLSQNCFKIGSYFHPILLVLPNIDMALYELGLYENYSLLLTNMSAEDLNQSSFLFQNVYHVRVYLPFEQNNFTLEDGISSSQDVSVFFEDEWHLCRFVVYGMMKKLYICLTGSELTEPLACNESYAVTSEGPVLADIRWDLNGDGIADELPETIYEDVMAEALYRIQEKEHSWAIKTVFQESTCTQSGDVLYYCIGCGEEKRVQTEALGHKFSKDWTMDREAGCTEIGEKSHHCTREGCTERISVTPVLGTGHIWDEGIITIDPQIGVEGERDFTCIVCKEHKKEKIAALPEQSAIPTMPTPVESVLPYESVEPVESDIPQVSAVPDQPEATGKTNIPNPSVIPKPTALPKSSVQPDLSAPSQKTAEPRGSNEPMATDGIDISITNQGLTARSANTTVSSVHVKEAGTLRVRVKANYSKIILNWEVKNKNVQYWIFRSEKKKGKGILLKKLKGSQTGYSDKRVVVGKTYYYQISVMQEIEGNMKNCGSSKICKATLKVRKAPVVHIRKKRQGKIRYLEITLRKYTGKRLEILYRKRKMGAYRRLKLRTNDISKNNKFRIKYMSNSRNLFIRFRTYEKQGKVRIYSHYTKEKRISF